MRKDSFTLKFYTSTDKKQLNGEIPIYLRIMVNRKKVELSTRMVLQNEREWDPISQRIKIKSPVNNQLNQIEGQVTSHYRG
jgi:hypothetical protein